MEGREFGAYRKQSERFLETRTTPLGEHWILEQKNLLALFASVCINSLLHCMRMQIMLPTRTM
jgi:hypothetical protein